MKSKHIEVKVVDARVVVIVDDFELFDFVDDLLVEQDLHSEYLSHDERGGREVHTLYFAKGVQESVVAKAIAAIPEDEIERIWKLNNPDSEA